LLLAFLRSMAPSKRATGASPNQDVGVGLREVMTNPVVRALIVLGLIGEVFGNGHKVMLPVMARDVLEVGPTGLGYLYSAGNFGALIASLILSTGSIVTHVGRLMAAGYFGMGVFLILFARSPWLAASLSLLAVAYFMGTDAFMFLETMLQTSVPDEIRGRVLSVQFFGFGLSDVMGIQTGAIAALLGAPVAIAIGAAILVTNALTMLKGVSARFGDQQERCR